jgi:hypothetical protein
MSVTEILGFVTGALCVVLVVRRSIWNWPAGLANNGFYLVLFAEAGLYADAGLQIVYLIWRVVLSSGVLKSPPDSGFRRGTQGRDGWPGPGWRACQGDARSD